MRHAFTFLTLLAFSTMLSAHQPNSYEVVADELAEQLATQMRNNFTDDGYSQLGITRWVMADTLALPAPHDSVAGLSHQLSESLYTHLQERNMRLVEFRAQNFVTVTEHGSTALTRDVEQLNAEPNLDWILVGTMAREADGVIVNLRVVDRRSQSVLASANRFVPKSLYWENFRSTEMVNGKLQRHD